MEFYLYTIERKGLFFKSYDIMQDGQLRYRVKAKPFSFKRHYRFLDHNSLEIMQIERRFAFFKIKFQLRNYEKVIADVVRKSAFKSTDLEINSSYGDYYVEGNFWKTDFTIMRGLDEVAKVSRKRGLGPSQYGVAIKYTEEPVFILGITMIIEIILRILRTRKS